MITKTELANLDDLKTEAQSAADLVDILSSVMGELKDWVGTLPERWAEAGWGTASLDASINDVSEAAAALKTPDQVLEHLQAIQVELRRAQTIGEAATAAGATGNLSRFTTEQTTSPGRGTDKNAPPVQAPGNRLEARIRNAYSTLSAGTGSPWVGLAALRGYLVDVPAERLDPALQQLSRQVGVHVQAEANQQALTEADREAAVTFGGSARHLLKIEESGRRSRAAVPEQGDR